MKLGLLGKDIGYSLSPLLHRCFGETLGIEVEYNLLDLASLKLEDESIIEYCRKENYRGINVTIPLKLVMIPFLDDLSLEVSQIGAVNTVSFEDRVRGFNSDFFALKKLIDSNFDSLKGPNRFLIKGAGGFAKAAAYALASFDNVTICLVNRTFERARELQSELQSQDIQALAIDERTLYREDVSFDGLMNATPIGMGESLNMPFDFKLIKKARFVIESIYAPRKTMLLNVADQAGCKTISGLEILFHQGASSFEIWSGRTVDREEAWNLFLSKLDR